ncbi:hypothetical protein FQR65_LT11267 [Abscondita terminalis]|nr:hypothetical protein FQR65_LT11267 [Abscondita terminalis]
MNEGKETENIIDSDKDFSSNNSFKIYPQIKLKKENRNMPQTHSVTPIQEETQNAALISELKKTLVTIAWWARALTVNVSIGALVGVALGAGYGYAYALLSEPCITEANSYLVERCGRNSSYIADGALYGAAATALIGVAGTAVSFFKSPTRENAKNTMKASFGVVGFCCRALSND